MWIRLITRETGRLMRSPGDVGVANAGVSQPWTYNALGIPGAKRPPVGGCLRYGFNSFIKVNGSAMSVMIPNYNSNF